ncbi:endo alpha-1,4 polygalactosaminidase, partial [Nocardia alni]|uniref:endo alpha-1,4 polygalactosaminidase n=1 Tax=Nocardia alni TaxID=2815723 RepID=UPI001C21E3A3
AADYQLGGPYPPPAGVTIVTRDSTAAPVAGVYNVCYVNGFQTQPGEQELWRGQRRDLLLSGADGKLVVDDNWPDEYLLDTSTPEGRSKLAEILGRTITGCAAAGFQAVEFDNLDSYTRSGGRLTAADNLALAALLSRIAHDAGLLTGQKNSPDLGEQAKREASFDFAVAEECLQFHECDKYSSTYGGRVVDIEYTDDLPGPLDTVCAQPDRPAFTLIRDRKLVPQGDAGYFYQHC